MPTRSQSISMFLKNCGVSDLSSLYSIDMECQVNVGQDGGEPTDGEYKGKRWKGWTDGITMWKSFRIPFNAAKDPTYEDSEMKFDLAKHAEAIGMTGWDWKNRCSKWVAFDFDALTGHSDKHTKKLDDDELKRIISEVQNIEWVTLRKSTSGKGLHLYVFLDNIKTDNHNEHAALARAILSKLSALTGYDFNSKVDICGGNMWVWHRKQKGTDGLSLLKMGTTLNDVPINWRDHVKVVSGLKKRVNPDFIEKIGEDKFDELSGQNQKVQLDAEHKQLITFLQEKGNTCWWWDSERHMLVTHTIHLKDAHEALSFKGIFSTLSTGVDKGHDWNVYCFPLKRGAWAVRRFSPGCAEHDSWMQDSAGWTRCFYNKQPDLLTASRTYGGIELPNNGGFQFREAELAVKAANHLGIDVKLDGVLSFREAVLKEQKDGRIVFEIENLNDPATSMNGWASIGKKWKRVFLGTKGTAEIEVDSTDDIMRHLVTDIDRQNAGWVVFCDDRWHQEPLEHVKAVLKSEGVKPSDVEINIGNAVKKAWKIVNIPFQVEYPGDRQWNRKAAKLRYVPTQNTENLKYPHWSKILNHIGKNLNDAVKQHPWCKVNGILTGADYLACWIASMFQDPMEPTPYLFLFGPQDCGKSILYEALSTLMINGFARADKALENESGFNGELENAVLCVVEETDLRKSKHAYNRIKDWVTSKMILIHPKTKTPYLLPNSTHWIQTANDHNACPVFPDDTRITVIRVDEIDPVDLIPKHKLEELLRAEASDFLAYILDIELPPPISRLNVPVIETVEKANAQSSHVNILHTFMKNCVFDFPGNLIPFSELYEKFLENVPAEDRGYWTNIRFSKEMPTKYLKGSGVGNRTFLGNISLTKPHEAQIFTKKMVANQKGYLVEEPI